ncbi:Hypothetical predicted protein [Mytilus galloprovincialis]|uniref:Uncharacterized protein n=1 Tax=Mytilus galloprovincialis TaxID=29158 RepID=A0A8B6DQ33_MYTGA|nr:Hypothetical predicted protein [Mytilus galloprovincialis]
MFLECMGGLFPGCDEYIFAQTMVNSIIKNRIPQTFNPMSCFGVSGPSKFVAEVKINATWDEDLRSAETSKYRQLKSTIEQQAWMMFSNKVLVLKDNIETIDVLSFKPGSIIVEFAVIIKMNSDFYKTLQLEDFRQELLRAINELKMNPPTAPNYFTSVDDDSINITGSDDGNQEVSTPSTTTLAPDCNSMTYISSIIDSQCESSKSRLRMVNKDRKCSVLLDMIGCALFHTHICNKEQIVSTMSMDSWSMIGQNVSVFDPISCFGQGNEVVLPTIVPLNVTMMPCVNPDVVHYILNYDCYYYGLQKQMQGDDKLDSCRMYWYSSACLYGTLQTNKDKLGQCSLEEVNGVLTKYEDELFKVSPDNVTMSECLGLYKSADKCTRAMYSDDVFTIVQTCYGTAVANRMTAAYGIMDLSDYPCLIYQEMSECLYRPIKEHQLCLANQTEVMEDHMIWLTNGLNDIMTIAMGSPLDERKTVEKCIANVTKTPDFGQDLCDDGAGLIMSEITCLYYIGNPVCNSLESVYIPCLSNGLSRKRIFCSAERIWRSLSVVGDLFGKLTYGRVEISSCNRDTGSKQGTCPAVGNHTVGICVEECSGDYNCTGNQKCCSNGCGHVCMDPDSKNDSGRFNITIRFDLDWRPEYREENSTFRTTLTNELNKIIASSELKAYLKYIRVMVLRPGSIIAGCEAEFDKDIAEHKLEMTLKTRIEEIQDDPEYTILQKWSNLSVETLPDIHSYQFEITIKFDIPWESEYTDKTSVNYQNLTREILKQMAIISGDFRSSNISSMKITVLRQGSVYVVFEVIYYYQKTTSDVRSGMLGFVTAARMDPKSELDLIKAVDTDHIYVRIITEVSTPPTATPVPDCNNMTYISSIIDNKCGSAKSQLRLVDKDRKCSVLLDMIGCVLFQTHICNKEQIVSTMSRDSWSMIGQNISLFDPISCFGPGNEVVLPTIVPLNVTLMPCVHPDVVHYILNYDCYYYGLQKQMQGDDKLDSCRMYWYSSACLYITLQTNKDQLGQCSLEEVNGVLTKYEDELFKVSPDNVTMSECLGLYKSADKCTRAMYSDDVFTIVQTCYGTAVSNRISAAYGIMDTSDYPCLIYQEMAECLYRPIKEHQLCLANETEVMEDHMIWLTNGFNDIMTIAMGSPLDERKTVETCIANVTKTPDFGQDLCDDGAGLIMSEITCLYSIGDQICNSLESAYIPCLSNGLSRKRIFCSAERIWRSLSVVSDLFGKLTQGRVDISSCNRDTSGKQGTCPAVGNHTVGICVEECSGDYNCTGDQKCCSNGCGHVCMDPDSNKDESGRFNITIRFDLDWRPEYREENSTFRTTLSSELNRIIASSELKAYLKYIRVVVLRPGSIIAGCEAEFDMDITEHKLEMTLKTRIEEIQDDPEYIILQKWSNLSVEILPESEDVCTDVTKIARELQVCSSYLNYTQFKDNRTNCGLYNYFLNCVVSSVTANRQKCTRDSLEGIMQTVFESIGRSDLKALLSCSGQGSVYFRADLEYMKRVIRSHFSDTRHHAPQYSAYKQTAKQFIFDEFQRFGLDTEYHTFNDTEVSSTATFQSVIGVLKGTRFGTADDLISGLGAHYDTVNTSKGVDDNGSGVAAMLEVVRQITNINNSGYKSKNTIIFVSFDLEEYGGLSGSRNFLQDWLTPWLIKNYGSTIPEKLQGVIILDTIMEYNTSSQSQVFPLGALDQFQQFFPSAVESILSDDARGDFISLIYRQPTDDRVLAETFDSSWAAAGRSEFEIESFPLPFADLSSVPQENLALMYQFLRSDHANFWGANLPAIFLTDSANFRGDMIQCYHNPCDDLDTMLTDDNVNFLGKIADTVTATIHRLSEPFIPEDVDGICEDSMLMELIVNQSCTSYLQGFQNQSSCQALSSMVDRCLSPLMPGVTCDRNRMLSHVVTMVMVAKMLPVGFNISTCGSANHSNNAKQSISDMCLGQWGSCASQQDCHMVTWSYNLNTQMISFNVTAAIDSDKWMGVGFNGQKEMAGSDALVGWITPQATVTVTDRNNPSYYGSFLDTTQNVKNADWDRMNGITSISFQRHRDTKDTSDFIFSEDNCAYFIYPMGGSYNENDKSINMHSKTPTISLEQFCFPCAECKHLTLPDIRNKRLKDLLYYSVSPTCLRLDACFSPSIKIGRKTIKKSFKAFVDVDNCNFIVTLGFEGWRKSLILISYDWGDGSLKGLVESLGNKMTSEGFKLVLKQFGLDKIFPSSPCTVPDFTTDCPLVMDPKKYLPSNLHGMVRCNMTNDCFGLHCCLDLKFTVPFGVDIIELSVPMLFKMDSCNFEIEARFGNFKHKSSILNYDWAHFNVTL